MQHSAELEASQLRHMRASMLPRPCNPAEALSLKPLQTVLVTTGAARGGAFMGTVSTLLNYAIKRPPSGTPGEGARAALHADSLALYSGGPNPKTWALFNNLTM